MILSNILNKLGRKDKFTIGELTSIDQARQTKAASCKVKLVRTFHVLKKESLLDKFRSAFLGKRNLLIYYLVFKFRVVSDTGKIHYVFIKADPDFSLTGWNHNRVQIYCDCADFQYRSAKTLKSRDSLFENIHLKIPDTPTKGVRRHVTPTLLCKHAFAALSWLKSNYKEVMRTV